MIKTPFTGNWKYILDKIGTLGNLLTTAKDNLVDAINEIFSDLDTHKSNFNDHSARHENTGADEISIAGLQGESAELSSHLSETMPHQFVDEDTSTTYKYGLKQEDGHMVFMYEEVV